MPGFYRSLLRLPFAARSAPADRERWWLKCVAILFACGDVTTKLRTRARQAVLGLISRCECRADQNLPK